LSIPSTPSKPTAPPRIGRRLLGPGAAWLRARQRHLPAVILAVSIPVALLSAAWLLRAMHQNRIIADLGSGHDIAVAAGDAPELLFGRAKYLLDHGQLEQAQPLAERVAQRGPPAMAADMLYDQGNARLHHAIRLIAENKLDAATGDVVLARDYYTRCLRIEPGFWDAKYNLDIAMRLVRDFPDFESHAEDLQRPTSKLWTDLPGLPKGGP
jgi:mxaK protein